MSSNFPTSLDTLTNPTATDPQNNPSHAGQHSDANDALEAIEAKVGINSSAVQTSHDYKLSTVTDANKAETQANKRTSFQVTPNDTAYPSEKLVKDSLDAKAPLTSPTFATSINGSYLTASQVLGTDGSKNIVSLPVATYPSLTELAFVKGVTSAIQTQLGARELLTNKSTSVTTDGTSDTKYPSVKAVKDYADGLVAGLLDYRGAYDASVNTFPASGGSGTAGAVLKGDMWVISVVGTLGGTAVQIGDSLIANTDTPGQTASNWNILNGNISYVPEDVANKETSALDTSNTKYPCNNVVKSAVDGKMANPMTTAGDTIYGGASGVPTRLGIGTAGQVLTVNSGATAPEWADPSGGGTSLWTAITGTRASNTTITVVGDQTAIFKKGMIVRWQESGVDKVGMVSIPSTYSSPNTTITIIGDTCASIDTDTFKYSVILGAEQFTKMFAIAGTIGATATNVANTITAMEPMRVIGADLWTGKDTPGTTNNTTVDINKNGTTIFTTKPTLATTVQSSPLPFTADTTSALALGDDLTLDIDAVQTTAAIDLYVQLYVFPERFLTLS